MATSRAPQMQQVRFEEPYRRPSPPTGEAWTIASDQSDRTPAFSSDRTRDVFEDYFVPQPATARRAPSFSYEANSTSPLSARSVRRTPSPAVDGLEDRPASDQIEHSARCVAESSYYLRYAAKHLQGKTGGSAKAHKVAEASDRLLDQAFRLDLWKTEVDLNHLLPFADSGMRPLAVMGRTLSRLKELTRTLELQCERYDTSIPPPSAAYRDKDAYDSGTGESDGESRSIAGLCDPDNPDQVYSLEQSLHSVDAKLSTLRRLTRSVRSAGPDPGAQALDMHILEMFDMFGTAEAMAESGVEPENEPKSVMDDITFLKAKLDPSLCFWIYRMTGGMGFATAKSHSVRQRHCTNVQDDAHGILRQHEALCIGMADEKLTPVHLGSRIQQFFASLGVRRVSHAILYQSEHSHQ
ncbi:hypothetical protein B0A48_10869 [Cryoendolithus antarcticus]|uniref:Uncharacterized protein n=1 Tax=Cryoendolithus antarcticus TaxID=1507870 RepID=A0A1V8SZ70_9PEZI|nr:hypothetical protein B0A48_10869 [Cryoendolithus antarcticus]